MSKTQKQQEQRRRFRRKQRREKNLGAIRPKKDEFGRRLVEVGQVIPEMVKQMEKGLLECINQNVYRRGIYWILYTADWYRNGEEFRDSFTPMAVKPPKMLNTICWKIDNKRGSLVQEWVLPKDAPAEASSIIESGGIVDENIVRAATGMPLVY
jgi:hypothetical protein